MIRYLSVALFCVASLDACTSAASPALRPQQAGAPTPEDTVYAVVLDSLYSRANLPILLLADSTMGAIPFGPRDSTGLATFARLVRDLPAEVVADFQARNSRPARLRVEAIRGVRLPLAMLTGEQERAAEEDSLGVWVFQQYPGARVVLTLSRVGFSSDRRLALLHVVSTCGSRCGGTRLILVERRADGRWAVRDTERGITF